MKITLHVWRQQDAAGPGSMVAFPVEEVAPEVRLLDLLAQVNVGLRERGERPIAFAEGCRDGSCGACGVMVNGLAHGPGPGRATCQVTLGEVGQRGHVWLEPWRATAFPVVQDLVVDRSALLRIQQAGGLEPAETANDPAACTACGACVAACKHASALLFVAAQAARGGRVVDLVRQTDAEGFGACGNHGECAAACPRRIPLHLITRLNRAYRGG